MKKVLKAIWACIKAPWVWIYRNIKDWHTLVLFAIVCAVVGSEVWVSYLIALIVGVSTPLGLTLVGFASACLVFWNLPGTPFLLICMGITLGIKAIINKIKNRVKNH